MNFVTSLLLTVTTTTMEARVTEAAILQKKLSSIGTTKTTQLFQLGFPNRIASLFTLSRHR